MGRTVTRCRVGSEECVKTGNVAVASAVMLLGNVSIQKIKK